MAATTGTAATGGGGLGSLMPGAGSILGLGVGAADLGLLLTQGEPSLPSEFNVLQETYAPTEFSQGQASYGQGQSYLAQGQQALAMAQKGQLTPEQAAQLSLYRTGLENTASQEYYNMGRSPTRDTSFISQQGLIDTQVNAMAQQQIQTTIQLGLGETSAGTSLESLGLGYESSANQALVAAGTAQMQNDQNYNGAIQNAFSAMAGVFSIAKKT